MTYSGIAMHPSLENGRKSGTISINENQVSFNYDGGSYAFPTKGIEITSGGSGNRVIYFRHPDSPEWCFYSGDNAIMKDPILLKSEGGKRSTSQVKSTQRILIGIALSAVLVVGILIASLFIFKEKIVYHIASTIPVEWEQKAGEAMFESITSQSTLIKDKDLNKKVNELGNILTKSVSDPAFKFKFYIVEDSTLNAFALPGGNVVIHSGLILNASSSDEVLGVLGHEIAHVTERHHARNLVSNMGISFIIKNFLGFDSDLANLVIDAGGTLASLKYNRDLETEADNKGWEYLVKSDINPKGMISFFKKLQSKSAMEKDDEEKYNFLSTHPATSERIKGLEKKLSKTLKEKSFTEVNFDFSSFKNELKKELNK